MFLLLVCVLKGNRHSINNQTQYLHTPLFLIKEEKWLWGDLRHFHEVYAYFMWYISVQAGSLCAPSGFVGAAKRSRRPSTCAASNQHLALPEHHTLHAARTWTLCAPYHRSSGKQDTQGICEPRNHKTVGVFWVINVSSGGMCPINELQVRRDNMENQISI